MTVLNASSDVVLALILGGLVLIVINLWATVVAIRSDMFEPLQKAMQIALIWLVPALGAFLVFGFARPPEVEMTCPGILGPFITWKRLPGWLNRSAA